MCNVHVCKLVMLDMLHVLRMRLSSHLHRHNMRTSLIRRSVGIAIHGKTDYGSTVQSPPQIGFLTREY